MTTPILGTFPQHAAQEHLDCLGLQRLRDEGRLLFGLARLHHLPTKKARLRLLETALDAGISYFDVAPAYGNGLAERTIGALSSSLRSKLKVNTKAGLPARIYPPSLDGVFPIPRLVDHLLGTHNLAYRTRDFSPSTLRNSLEGSLERLGIESVEVLFLHEPIEPFATGALESVQEAMNTLKAEGKIRGWGIAGPRRRYYSIGQLPVGVQFQMPVTEWYEEAEAPPNEPAAILYGAHAFSKAMANLGGLNLLLDACKQRREMAKIILATSLPNRISGWFNEEAR